MSSDVPMADAGDGELELLVWPWTGILATTATQDDGVTLAAHAQQHPATVVATTALQQQDNNSSFLVLHFGKSWAGFRGAMSLADRFAGAGRREWRHRKSAGSVVVYGWVAGVEDLHGDDAVGRFLRETGAVAMSAEDVFGRGDVSDALAKLASVAGEYDRRMASMAAAVRTVEEERSSLHDELTELRNIVDNIVPELNHYVDEFGRRNYVDEENRKLKTKLDATINGIESKMKKMMQREDDGRSNLEKREKEDVLARILELEKELHEKRESELELMVLNWALFRKERESNIELQETRMEALWALEDMLSGRRRRTVIGIKRMGEIDEKPFQDACRKKYGNDDYQTAAAELVSCWQEEIQKPSWHPFKIVSVNGKDKQVVDDDDVRLRNLWIEYGDDVCNAVKTALMEINEYNPSGGYTVSELWNFKEQRKATLTEVIQAIFRKMKRMKKRRRG